MFILIPVSCSRSLLLRRMWSTIYTLPATQAVSQQKCRSAFFSLSTAKCFSWAEGGRTTSRRMYLQLTDLWPLRISLMLCGEAQFRKKGKKKKSCNGLIQSRLFNYLHRYKPLDTLELLLKCGNPPLLTSRELFIHYKEWPVYLIH